ncbi:aspartate aminotransferase family protein [Cognatishimia sp.]|uniref:aspartate aminotransferase family protein n=1 Tax=Cognatishimia sp. TaxID=2211648 RepID=UPI003511543C|nr:aminotransferase class III-fold pyridoxal phosphate-dependent enzyme [Cognatishimia sp.]
MTSQTNDALAEWSRRAERVMPGKQSNFRPGPDVPPVIAARAQGLRITDVNGKDFIDFTLGMGPGLLGYDNPRIREAVVAQMDRIMIAASGAMHHTAEIELAERIVEHVPCAEQVRFGISGTEADLMVMRLARGVSGKTHVLRFENHYHGWADTSFGGRLEGGSAEPVHGAELGAGIAAHAHSDVLMCPWNDADALERVLQAHGDKIALVIMEAVMCNNGCCPPRRGYLEAVRVICDRYGVLLCFDEVITGFRMGIGGAQGHYGVTPDLAVFGKAMAGGLPLSAVAGRREIMAYLKDNRVLGGGTFNSFPLATASAIAGIDMLAENDGALYRQMAVVQEKIATGLKEAAGRHGFQLMVQGPLGFLFFAFTEKEGAYTPTDLAGADMKLAMRLRGWMEESGVLVAGGSRLVMSPMMTDLEVSDALTRFDRAFAGLASEQ